MNLSNLDTYREDFNRDGFVMVRNAIKADQLAELRNELNGWIEESKKFTSDYGITIDGRPRFDVEPNSHSAKSPALRRISSPIEISQAFLDFSRNNLALDLTAHIFGPNIKLVNSKINLNTP